METDFFEMENGNPLFDSLLNQAETKPSESKGETPPDKIGGSFLSSFLVELVHCLKSSLTSVKNFSVLSIDRSEDPEFRKYSQKMISEDIKKIDTVLNSLLNFININTPIVKTHSINIILEEILEANEKQFRDKKIKVFKRFEQGIPETTIHHEQVRFILHSTLQYAILSVAVSGSIGFMMRSSDFQKEAGDKTGPDCSPGYIEVVVGFIGEKRPADQFGNVSEIHGGQKEEAVNLILQLVKEIIDKHHGMMKLEVDKKKPRTLVTLRFPVERRKIIHYEPIAL